MPSTRLIKIDKKFAVFDIDGTLIRWQLFHSVVNDLAKAGHLGEAAHETIREARLRWKKRAHPEAFREYENVLVDTYLQTIHTVPVASFDQIVTKTIAEHKEQTYTFTRNLARDLKAQGYLLFAISGSHHEAVELLARHYGFDDWVGSLLERKGGTFTGKSSVGHRGKHKILEQLAAKHEVTFQDSVGVGDSKSDASFLEMVERPIAFNPDQQLYEIARGRDWPIVIERKNMIYELQSKDGSYVLAKTNAS